MTRARVEYAVLIVAAALTLAAPASGARAPLRDAPVVWYEDDRRPVPKPQPRDPSVKWDYYDDSIAQPRERITDPTRIVRAIGAWFGGDRVPPADNVNALDEVPGSTWFTNRIGMYPMSPEAAAAGRGGEPGPDRSTRWEVISAKTEGVTPGFNIRDGRGDVYVIKFDPPGYLNMTTAAGVVSSRVLNAAGYNVPIDHAVRFVRGDLAVSPDARIRVHGKKRPMTEADVDSVLSRVERLDDGRWVALASRFLEGQPLGPTPQYGRRGDDPNDHINHENRRELRGLYPIAAWINHFDLKQHQTLDMYVGEDGRGHVVHNLLDFASTLGGGATGPIRRYGYEFGFDLKAAMTRTATLGLKEDEWRRLELSHGFTEVGYFEWEEFHPEGFRTLQPNWWFANRTPRDEYWGAKIVGAFRDEHIDAIVDAARYIDPGAAAYMKKALRMRRDTIVRYFFDRTPPLDFFRREGEVLRFEDLGLRYGVYDPETSRYRYRCAVVDADRAAAGRGEWVELDATGVALDGAPVTAALAAASEGSHPFIAIELAVSRGEGWSGPVTVYVARGSGRVVAVDR